MHRGNHFEHHGHHGHPMAKRAERARGRFGGPPSGGRDDLFGGGFGRRGPRRSRRGDVRAGMLLLLEEQPRNGYQLIGELQERSGGAWRPSPGSIYPILSQLEDEGLIVVVPAESGRTFALSDQGRAYVEAERGTLGKPWDVAAAGIGDAAVEMMVIARQVAAAIRQVISAGTDHQQRAAATVLAETRRSLYRILADDVSSGVDEGTAGA